MRRQWSLDVAVSFIVIVSMFLRGVGDALFCSLEVKSLLADIHA